MRSDNFSELSHQFSYPVELTERGELSVPDTDEVTAFGVSHHRSSLRGQRAILIQEMGFDGYPEEFDDGAGRCGS